MEPEVCPYAHDNGVVTHRVEASAQTVVLGVVDGLNRGDWAAALHHVSADFEYDLTRTASPLQGIHSAAQMPRVLDEFLGSWESVRYEPREFIESGACLVVPFATHFRGRDGIELTSEATWVWRIRRGSIERLTLFQEREEALATVRTA